MNGVQTRFKCKLDVKRCKRFVFPPSSLLPRSNALKTKAIRYFQTDRTLTRIVSPPLPERGGISMFDYWKPILTDTFIKEIKARGGILINLASGEMKDLFDWKRVEQEVQVITPEFQVWKKGKLTTVVVYAKMCRGELTRFIIKNRIENPGDLKGFKWEGFSFDAGHSTDTHYLFSLLS